MVKYLYKIAFFCIYLQKLRNLYIFAVYNNKKTNKLSLINVEFL